MKKYYLLLKTVPICILAIILCSAGTPFKSAQNGDVGAIVDSKNYAFNIAHLPTGNFAPGVYYLKVINDSISVHLPYSGTSNSAAYTSDENGINVNSKDFTYSAIHTKKGGFSIKINLKNDRVTQSFLLSINNKGYATLTAEEQNRDPISFYGPINSN